MCKGMRMSARFEVHIVATCLLIKDISIDEERSVASHELIDYGVLWAIEANSNNRAQRCKRVQQLSHTNIKCAAHRHLAMAAS
jgi:hypothetical protein